MEKQHRPPVWILRWLEGMCDPYLIEGIIGDLDELFLDNVKSKGLLRSRLIYMFHALGFVRLIFIKKPKRISNMKSIWMNYFLATYRSIRKHKSYFAINLVGLVLAITCGWFAIVYIMDEFKYDQMHSDKDQIYRLYKRNFNPNENVDHYTYETSGMMTPTMAEEYPEVVSFTRFCPWFDGAIITNESEIINIATEKVFFADSNFFEFFDYELAVGNPTTFLSAPSTMVINESLAKSLFGDENPIGKTVIGLHDLNYTITGVFKDLPRHSSLDFEVIISWSTTVPNIGPLNYSWMNNWLAQGIFSFVKLSPDANAKSLVDKLPDMMQRHFPERADRYTLSLISINDMYLSSDRIKYSRGTKDGSQTFIKVLGFSALLIFAIAALNYINITLSRATQTSHEVGIRKVLGSSKRQLMGRFMLETFLSTLAASVISIMIITVLLPDINALSGKDLPRSSFFQFESLGLITFFVVAISLIVGSYPAWVMSAPKVSKILKGGFTHKGGGSLKKVLLTLQYAISILLIICTIFITRQLNYLENKPLGFDKDHVLVIDVNNEVGDNNADVFEAELLKNSNILDVTTSRAAVGAGSYTTTIFTEGGSEEISVRIYGVDPGFFHVYGMNASQGRFFRRGSIADSANMIVNQAFLRQVGWEDGLGKKMKFSEEGNYYPIIGVVDDFHYSSLRDSRIEPMVLYLNPVTKWNTSVKVSASNLKSTIEHIESAWESVATRTPLNYYFVDDWFNNLYKKDRQLYKISTLYSIISLILCGLGLYGLTSLLLQQKMKEISIRKVLGASVGSIVNLINRQFALLILISFIAMVPLGYYLITSWLDQFAYHIAMDLMPFLFAGLIILVTSLLIISGLSIKSANLNPSETLSNE